MRTAGKLQLMVLVLVYHGAAAFAGGPRFTGLYQTFDQPYNIVTSALAEMDNNGPLPGKFRPLGRRLSDITIDPNGSGYYGCYSHEVFRIDPVTLAATRMTVAGPGITDTSWPIAMTYDTARSRVLLATLAGQGFFFSYSPASGQWAFIRDLGGYDFQSILYRASNDMTYALPNNGTMIPITELYRFNAAGEFLGTTPLLGSIPGTEVAGDSNYQLLMGSDGQFVVLTPPIQPGARHIYGVSPDTGAVSFRGVLVPEPCGGLVVVALAGFSVLRRQCRQRAPSEHETGPAACSMPR
jgi:hypothetical protein